MFWRVLWRSVRHRRARLGVAVLAVLLGTALVSAVVNLSFDVGGQTGREMRAYGANILVLPRTGTLSPGGLGEEPGIAEPDLAALDGVSGVVAYVPYLYLAGRVQGQPLVAAGVAFERLPTASPWWRVVGRWPTGVDEALVGVDTARALALTSGERFALGVQEGQREFVVAGLVEAGGAEDNQVFIPLAAAQMLSGRPGQAGLVQVSALSTGRPLAEIAADIEARLPGVRARTQRQLAQAEETVLGKIRLLMALVAAAVLGVAALAVGSTMATAVLERRAEIGLMKALGAAHRQVAALFLAEAVSIGVAGGLGGYAAGVGIAALVGRQVFQAQVSPDPLGLPMTLAVATAVALAASWWAARRALAVDAAVTLRGE